MALNVTQLKQDRAKKVADMRKLNDEMVNNGGETAEESEKFAKMEEEIRALERIIAREEKLQEEEAKLAQLEDQRSKQTGHDRFDSIRYPLDGGRVLNRAELERRRAFAVQGWLLAQKPSMQSLITDEHRAAAKFFGFDLGYKEICLPIDKDYRHVRNEYRDMSLTVGSGGYTVPEGFSGSLEQALLAYGGMRQVATVRRTASGNDLPWPTTNDTSNKGAILAEATTFSTSVDPSFGVVTFKAFKYSSTPIIVSNELLQDSAFDLAAEIGGWLGTRIGRIQNDHFSTGGGTTLPKGISIAGSNGKTATATNTFTDVEVIDLQHSVDPAYRPNARWMMHDTMLAFIRKMKDSTTGQYLWQPGMQAGVPDRLLGYQYTINQSLASALTTGQKLLYFGDFSKYVIRDVAEIRLVRLDELFAQTDQVGFVAFMRSDGNLLDAGTKPVKWLNLA